MTRRLGYSKNIIDSLQEEPLRFSALKNKLRISGKVLSYNLKALLFQGIVEYFYVADAKYYKLASSIRITNLKEKLAERITNGRIFMNPDRALFVLNTENNGELFLNEFPKLAFPGGAPYIEYRGLQRPEDIAQQIVGDRIGNMQEGEFIGFYARLVFFGFLLELNNASPQMKIKPRKVAIRSKEIDSEVPLQNPFLPKFSNVESQGIRYSFLEKIKGTVSMDEFHDRLCELVESRKYPHEDDDIFIPTGYIMARIFGRLMESATEFLGFQDHAVLDPFSRDLIHQALYKKYALLERHVEREKWRRERKSGGKSIARTDPPKENPTVQSVSPMLLNAFTKKWNFHKLKKDLCKQGEMQRKLTEDLMKPFQVLYIWAPCLSSEYLRKLKDSEEAKEFDDWFEKLKQGHLDHRRWIFSGSVERALTILIKLLQQKPDHLPSDFRIDGERFMQTSFLFENHPRGKSPEFYSEILAAIKKRKEAMSSEHSQVIEAKH